jgi:DNA-3-methyladenine glycosylase
VLKPRPIARPFYDRPPDVVAKELLGKLLVRDLDGETLIGRITETEAYFGADDPASHAYAGQTPRNSVMFGPPGFAYVYFIYGMHFCLNVSCLPPGTAAAVLVRAVVPVEGVDTMARLRKQSPAAKPALLTGGPGKLCQAMGITIANSNGLDLTDPVSPVRLEYDGQSPPPHVVTPRIGLKKAVELPYRFVVQGHPL